MDFPLAPRRNEANSDSLLDAFLSYLAEKGVEPYPAQEEAILELFDDRNVILNTPTGSGKSLVAAALHFYSASRRRRSVYTCPIKALVNEKFLALCRDFGPENVGMMTGDASVNHNAPILCCTAEILSNIALRDGPKACFDDVVMDEFHYYSDQDRGVAWQVPLLTLPHCRFLLMSATLGETRFFAKELERLTGAKCSIVAGRERPVPLEFSYVEATLQECMEKLAEQSKIPAYIVHFTQRNASETALNLVSSNPCTKEEKTVLKESLQNERFTSPFGKDMKRLLQNGIGLHHAGLLPKYRVLVEKLAQKGLLKYICGTDTLGVGVNVPIRAVVFTELCKYSGRSTAILTARDFHQISGRAGRKGFDNIGYVVALPPEHVVENKRLEAKAGDDPKKRRRLVKRKPPPRGFVQWDEQTFLKLQTAEPEPLRSQFKVTHGMLLNVLSRDGDGCRAMRDLINDSHETATAKQRHRREGFQLFRGLVERSIIEISPNRDDPQKLRVNVELQDDFSLNQTLALYCVDTLALLDVDAADYPLKLLSLVESVLENPKVILRKQLDKLKSDKMAEMKAAGLEYEERMAKLEDLEYPKPESEFIYETFNAFARKHPWVGEENIKPKSIAREMFERYSSFSDYIKLYGLTQSEGLLLRHLANVYRFIGNTVPIAFQTEPVREVIAYLEQLLTNTDSSLMEEWERLRDPNYVSPDAARDEAPLTPQVTDITQSKDGFLRLIRAELFQFLRTLANKSYSSLAESYDLAPLLRSSGVEKVKWPDVDLENLMLPYFESHSWIRLDPPARSREHTHLAEDPETKHWHIEQTLIDGEGLNDWTLAVEVDHVRSREEGRPALNWQSIGPIK